VVCETLVSEGYTARLRGFSAIDRYLRRDSLPFVLVETDAGLSDLARLFEGLRFPGSNLADGAVEYGGRDYFFHCLDPDEFPGDGDYRQPAFKVLLFSQDWRSRRFWDPLGFYPLLRQIRDGDTKAGRRANKPAWNELNSGAEYYRALAEGALILARYSRDGTIAGTGMPAFLFDRLPAGPRPREEEQRLLLLGLLGSPRPDLGLELLKAAGFVDEFWPELALLDDVDHSKEFHPEGNVWKHTLETFQYRKITGHGYDIRLSLGLLLHDVGKPLAESSHQRRFDGHAELGAHRARFFLERLRFEPELIADVCYLVKNHMLPAALPRLSLNRIGDILKSPLFPLLLELYRCDESSSFKGLNAFYESSAAYQAYLKYRRNPYRSLPGTI
jgi:poly(A) polymerase